MRKIIIILSVIVFITGSCGQITKRRGEISNMENAVYFENNENSRLNNNISYIDSLKKNFIPIMKGIWVLTDYINDIEKTKSPLKCQQKLLALDYKYILDEILTMVIDVTNQSDSIRVGASINNHEEYEFMIYFQTGHNNNSLKTNILDYNDPSNVYELSYKTINNVNYLFLSCYDKTNKLIGTKQFSKIADKQENNDVAWGIQYIVNKKLLSGDFLLIDNANAKIPVKFYDDGSVKGLSNFKTYYIVTDYLGDPIFLAIDEIIFRDEKHDIITQYAFQINKDTICLYSVILHEEVGIPFKLDELKYKLVRKR